MSQSARRFLLSDAIVLVASAALMLSSGRAVQWIWVTFSSLFGGAAFWGPWNMRRMAWSLALVGLSLPLLCSLALRATDRNRLRGGAPGLFVHLAVATVVALRLAGWATQASLCNQFGNWPHIGQPRWTVEVLDYLSDHLARDVAIAVLAGWLALGLVGRWTPERAWDDRLGRLVGVLWLIFYLGATLFLLPP